MDPKSSIILVGMPGAGKSTLGVLLAKELGLDFLDTDVSIQVHEGRSLQDIMDAEGYMRLREIEEMVLLKTDASGKVISTGGSAVYSDAGMQHLKAQGKVIFLDVTLDELRKRIHNFDTRGIARRPDQSFEALFEERCALYNKYADIRIDCNGFSPAELLDKIQAALNSGNA
ncbi:MAG: shikimate kinase [Pseudomonadales bacterium]|jgi:shikimate kinase